MDTSKNASKKPLRCMLDVRGISIENFKPPKAGRKWKAHASTLRSLLLEIATYADPDGHVGKFSPSMKTLQETGRSERSLYRHLDQLQELGFLQWNRVKHYYRREYVIRLPEGKEHLPDSKESPAKLERNTCQIGTEHLPDSQNHLPQLSGTSVSSVKEPSSSPSSSVSTKRRIDCEDQAGKEKLSQLETAFQDIAHNPLFVDSKKPGFEGLIREHGFPAVLDAVKQFAHGNDDWNTVRNPASLFMTRVVGYLLKASLATRTADKEKEMAAQAAIESEKYRAEQEEKFRKLREQPLTAEELFG